MSSATASEWSVASGVAGVEPDEVAVAARPLGVRPRDVRRAVRPPRRGVPGAERVEPGVELEPARVRLGDGELERVVGRARRAPFLARQELGPRLEVRRVERVRGGADLEHDGVEAQLDGTVQQVAQLGLLLRRGQVRAARPVDVGDGRDPGGAKLAPRAGQEGDVHRLLRVGHLGRHGRRGHRWGDRLRNPRRLVDHRRLVRGAACHRKEGEGGKKKARSTHGRSGREPQR